MNKASAGQRVSAGLTAAGMSGAAVFVYFTNPSRTGYMPVCPLFKMTGFACPGCGMTRGTHALLHGDVLGALDYNLLLPGLIFFFGYLFISLILVAWRGRGLDFRIFSPAVLWTSMVLALVFTIVRNLPLYPFSVLFP
jgi:hypothetical protein